VAEERFPYCLLLLPSRDQTRCEGRQRPVKKPTNRRKKQAHSVLPEVRNSLSADPAHTERVYFEWDLITRKLAKMKCTATSALEEVLPKIMQVEDLVQHTDQKERPKDKSARYKLFVLRREAYDLRLLLSRLNNIEAYLTQTFAGREQAVDQS
jgi:hypothetical protein